MKEINGIPSVIEGIAYYPQILVPNEKFKPAFYDLTSLNPEDIKAASLLETGSILLILSWYSRSLPITRTVLLMHTLV